MPLEQTWRWFGPKDPITLEEIKQTGATGIVTALHHIPTGTAWPVNEIMKRKQMIEAAGLRWSVAESIPVHENIKQRRGNYRKLIESYQKSVRNLGKCGVKTVCYNFMPVLDWSRTDLRVTFKDGSITTKFESDVFAAFDLFILKRIDAEKNYSPDKIRAAKKFYNSLDSRGKAKLIQTVLLGFPGSGEAYTLKGLRSALQQYDNISADDLRSNLHSFIREIIPTAEESGVRMAIHPDDPPWSLLGMPKAVSNAKDVQGILGSVDSPSNGITLCTGSFGAGIKNDLVDMAHRFASRINFVHLRNVSRNENGDFLEENHLAGDVDMYGVMREVVLEMQRRKNEGRSDAQIPMRPDHGHLMLADRVLAKLRRKDVYPGYSLFGRMRGLAELRGLEMGILRSIGL